MSNDLIVRDYLKTQGLKLPVEEVRVTQMLAQAVMASGHAAVEHDVLWPVDEDFALADHIVRNESNEAALKQIFMALDSAFERSKVRSATVYGLMKEGKPYLLRLAHQGEVIERIIDVDEEHIWSSLAARSAQTGWLNIADDVAHWVAQGELKGEACQRSQSQMSLPICLANGQVLGVLHVEAELKHAFNEEEQVTWIGLALALVEPMQAILGRNNTDEPEE